MSNSAKAELHSTFWLLHFLSNRWIIKKLSLARCLTRSLHGREVQLTTAIQRWPYKWPFKFHNRQPTIAAMRLVVLISTVHLLRLLPESWIWARRGSTQLPSEAHGCLSHYILWDSCMLMCTRGRGEQQSLGLPGRHWTRTPFTVGSQRHELGRLDIQETNEAPSQTGNTNQQKQWNTPDKKTYILNW